MKMRHAHFCHTLNESEHFCLACGGIYNTASGTLSSPNYPSPYGFDEDCRYEISIPSGNRIKLNFSYFNTESGFDFVTVGHSIQ
jgi:hypothetical protein